MPNKLASRSGTVAASQASGRLRQPVAPDRELDEDDDLALHPLEAADGLDEDLVGLLGDVLGREPLRTAVVVERLTA